MSYRTEDSEQQHLQGERQGS